MRTWGRDSNGAWIEVTETDYVWITTLIQNLKLNLGESPFYAENGIPAQRAVIQQIFPDFYVQQIQQQFSQYFASLQITKVAGTTTPTYNVNIITNQGTTVQTVIAT